MERAPEPTMEEILASIRRIIADDETTPGRQHGGPEPEPEAESFDIADQATDNQIIDDIARVLSGSGQGEQEDDILDLTKELGLSPVLEEAPSAETVEPEPVLEMLPDAELEPDAPMASSAAEAGFEQAGPASSANDDATSALEQAIAALRAGRLHSSVAEPQPEPELVLTEFTQEELVIGEPAPKEEASKEEASKEEASAAEAAEEPALEEPSFEDLVAGSDTFQAGTEQSWSSDLSDWRTETEPPAELDFVAARMAASANGAGAHQPSYAQDAIGASGKTLEDSVKEMLRPMLRQWLDENMSRVLTAALREELREGDMGRREG